MRGVNGMNNNHCLWTKSKVIGQKRFSSGVLISWARDNGVKHDCNFMFTQVVPIIGLSPPFRWLAVGPPITLSRPAACLLC